MARGIAQPSDTGSDILLNLPLTALSDVTGTGGTTNGTVGFDETGMRCEGNAARAQWLDLTGFATLNSQVQIRFLITTKSYEQVDQTTFTDGYVQIGTRHILETRHTSSSADDHFKLNMQSSGVSFFQYEDGMIAEQRSHSWGKGEYTEVCLWADRDAGTAGSYYDGVPMLEFTGVTFEAEDAFKRIAFGGAFSGTAIGTDFDIRVKDLVISNQIPGFVVGKNVFIGGDSFAMRYLVDNGGSYNPESFASAFWDNSFQYQFRKSAISRGVDATINAASFGTGGSSMCDTGAGDLSDDFATWAAAGADIYIIPAFNNDITSGSIAQITDGSTGTTANAIIGAETILASNSSAKIVYLTSGPIQGDVSFITTDFLNKQRIVNAITARLESDWKIAHPENPNAVRVLDLTAIMGGVGSNIIAQQGWMKTFGNSILTSLAISAGGTGHAIGDALSFTSSGVGLGVVAEVTAVSGSTVTAVSILFEGTKYISTETLTQAGTTGSGTGLILTATVTANNLPGDNQNNRHPSSIDSKVTGNAVGEFVYGELLAAGGGGGSGNIIGSFIK